MRWVLEQQFLSRNANHNIDGNRLVDPYHTINRIRTLEKQGEGLIVWPVQQIETLKVTFTSMACFPGLA